MIVNEVIEKILREAKRDRFALIIPPEWEEFVNQHIAEIFTAAKVTGILVDEHSKGVAYHCTDPSNVESIIENGFKVKPNEEDFLTFGGGVVYCWPERHDIKGAVLAETAVFKVEYDGHILRSIALEDADPRDIHQILIFPDAIKSVQYIGNVGKVEDLDKLLTKHFGSGLILSEIIQYDSYKELVELLYEVGDLAESVDLIENVVKMLDRITGRKSSKFTEWEPLEDILIKHFGEGFPFPEAPCCDSYGKLVDILYDVSNLLDINLEDIVETLDDICSQDAIRDENGELVYNQQHAAEILASQMNQDDLDINEKSDYMDNYEVDYRNPKFAKLKVIKSDDGKFIIPVMWQVYSTIRVEADNLQEALIRAQEHIDLIPLSSDPEYVDGSYEINVQDAEDAINAQRCRSVSSILIKRDGEIFL